jgi:hypothetical protein
MRLGDIANLLDAPWVAPLALTVAALGSLALAAATGWLAREGRASRKHDHEERRRERRLAQMQQASIHFRRSITRAETLTHARSLPLGFVPLGLVWRTAAVTRAIEAFVDTHGEAWVWLMPLKEDLLGDDLVARLDGATQNLLGSKLASTRRLRAYRTVVQEVLELLRQGLAEDLQAKPSRRRWRRRPGR